MSKLGTTLLRAERTPEAVAVSGHTAVAPSINLGWSGQGNELRTINKRKVEAKSSCLPCPDCNGGRGL